MDPARDPDLDIDNPVEPTFSNVVQESVSLGDFDICNIEDEQRTCTPSPHSVADYGGPTPDHQPQEMDNLTDIHALPRRTHGHAYVALPDIFHGRKENYRQFQRQFGLFLTANREEFKEKESMIWFTLSYMKGGAVELWANAYVDQALETNDWGTWEEFLDKLARDFGNKEEPHHALEELGCLQQGKRTVVEYFLRFEQLASMARIDVNQYPNTIQYIE
jgi:hypothetical protein